jgi:hypothetical protein
LVAAGFVAEGLVTEGSAPAEFSVFTVTAVGRVVGGTVDAAEVATGLLSAFGFVVVGADVFGVVVVPSSASVIDGRFLRVVLGSAFPVCAASCTVEPSAPSTDTSISEAGTVSGERRIVVVVVVGLGGLVVVGATVGGRVGSGSVGSGKVGVMATVATGAVGTTGVVKAGSGLAAGLLLRAVVEAVAFEPGLPLFFVLAGACVSLAGRAVSKTISAEPVADGGEVGGGGDVGDVGFADAPGLEEVAARLATTASVSPSVGVVAARAGTETTELVVLAAFDTFAAFVEVGATDDAAGRWPDGVPEAVVASTEKSDGLTTTTSSAPAGVRTRDES